VGKRISKQVTNLWSALIRIGPLHFRAGCHNRRLNLALVFLCLFCVIFMFLVLFCESGYFWVVVILCCQYQCNWLPGRTVPEMICCVEGDVKQLLTHSLTQLTLSMLLHYLLKYLAPFYSQQPIFLCHSVVAVICRIITCIGELAAFPSATVRWRKFEASGQFFLTWVSALRFINCLTLFGEAGGKDVHSIPGLR